MSATFNSSPDYYHDRWGSVSWNNEPLKNGKNFKRTPLKSSLSPHSSKTHSNQICGSPDLRMLSQRLDFLNNLSANISNSLPRNSKVLPVNVDKLTLAPPNSPYIEKKSYEKYATSKPDGINRNTLNTKMGDFYESESLAKVNRKLNLGIHLDNFDDGETPSITEMDDMIDELFLGVENVSNSQTSQSNNNNEIPRKKQLDTLEKNSKVLLHFDELNADSPRSSYTNISSSNSLDLDSNDHFNLSSFGENDNDLDSEQKRLHLVVSNLEPRYLVNVLKHYIKSGDKSLTRALATILPKSKFPGTTTHCVRCHKEFDNSKYGNQECIIRHREDDVIMISEDTSSAIFQCELCFSVFKLDKNFKYSRKLTPLVDCGACFIGKHSQYLDDIDSETEGFIQSCDERGCVEFYV